MQLDIRSAKMARLHFSPRTPEIALDIREQYGAAAKTKNRIFWVGKFLVASFVHEKHETMRVHEELVIIRAPIVRDHDPIPAGRSHRSLPQSSSASRFTAGAFGFLHLSQSRERPER